MRALIWEGLVKAEARIKPLAVAAAASSLMMIVTEAIMTTRMSPFAVAYLAREN